MEERIPSLSSLLSSPNLQASGISVPFNNSNISDVLLESRRQQGGERSFGSFPAFTFSPDPPAATMPPRQRSRGPVRAAEPPAASASTPRFRTSRRPSHHTRDDPRDPVAEGGAFTALGDPPAARRRSTRARKRQIETPDSREQSAGEEEQMHEQSTKRQKRAQLKKPPPANLKNDSPEDSKKPAVVDKPATCCICMDEPKPADLAEINGCEHFFCFDCIEKWAERENSCPLCKSRFTKINRVQKAKKKAGESTKNSKKVKQRDQRSDLAPGAALEGLLSSFAASSSLPPHRVARLIFSGMGTQSPFILSSAVRRGTGNHGPADRARAENPFLSDTDEDDDETSFFPAASFHGQAHPFSSFFRALPLGRGAPAGVFVGPNGFGSLRPTNQPARSYASNANDATAGRQADNPLEIADSDSDDDDVEVVQVSRTL